MTKQIYIVPNDLLASELLRGEWDTHSIPADPSRSVLTIEWDNHNDWSAFEQLAGVMIVGDPWDTISPEAAVLLASIGENAATPDPLTAAAPGQSLPATDTPVAPDSVATALKKTGWLGWRSIR